MSGTSSSFLTKSIILLALVLICMGTSMYFGKELGEDIMAFARDNIGENNVGVNADNDGGSSGFMLDPANERTSFGFDSDQFGTNQFQREWADPDEDELPASSDEPNVEITVLGSDLLLDDSVDDGSDDQGADDSTDDPDKPAVDDEESEQRIDFSLGDSSTFRIQVGTFSERENAENVWHDLTTAGYDASISTYPDGDLVRYRVQVGTYHVRDEADSVAEEIRRMGFDAWVFELESD